MGRLAGALLMGDVVTPVPAASVIVLRDAPLEVLMLQRSAKSSFVPNAWVFPGGVAEAGEEMVDVAVRETFEEAGIRLDRSQLVLTSRWITPAGLPKRFDTFFYIAEVARGVEVTIDAHEITAFAWMTPQDALARRDLQLVFPTIKNLQAIAAFETVEALLASRRGAVVEPVEPVLVNGKPALR